jgi:hypothetical protein
MDRLGLTRLELPAGSGYDLVLAYQDGPAEIAGAITSLLSLLGVIAGWGWATRQG